LKLGKIIFIEFKDGTNKLSAPQKYWKRIIEGLGFKYYVCYSVKKAQEKVEMARLSKASN